MRSKEEIMLAKLIIGISGFVLVAVFPPILFVGILGWAGYTLYKNNAR
tara:strand:+ start:359 stop:502 length:144 start_codon:yes stop_codon:yes gene_type:complete